MEWIERLLAGDHYAASKLISMIENKSPMVPELMKAIHPRTGKAITLGFTGPPGVGKSTIVDQFIYVACAKGLRVGVIAVDSSSPYSGGALLGDRIRMREYVENDDVFIRSMGSRGHLGGLSEATKGAMRILDALGCDLILVETVGVGQIELDIVKAVDTVLVATMPSTGDYVQTMKAGIMEIADIFVVNKSDLPGADLTCLEIEKVLDMAVNPKEWRPPVIQTCGTQGDGIKDLWQAMEEHQSFLNENGRREMRRQEQIRYEMADLVVKRLAHDFWSRWDEDPTFNELVQRVSLRDIDHYEATELMVNKIKEAIKHS